jgi:hypothetical protein
VDLQDLQDLHAARADWYQAYLAGDSVRLADLEEGTFFVVSDAGIETRASQLAGIDAAVKAGRWFPAGSHARDQGLEVHPVSKDIVSMRGVGRIVTPGGDHSPVLFTELWQRHAQGWKVVHLHYHRACASLQRGSE